MATENKTGTGTGKEDTLTGSDIIGTVNADAEKKKQEKADERNVEKLQAKNYRNEQTIRKLEKQLEFAKEEKRKPGISQVNEKGEPERKRPNSTGLNDLNLPPYTKNMVAIYKIIGTDEINPATGQKVDPVDSLIPGQYTFFDRYEKDVMKQNKVVSNIKGTKRLVVDGKAEIHENIEDIVFIRGYLQVPVMGHYPLYLFLELHPMNKTNKFRPRNSVVAFERIDISYRSPVAKGIQQDLSLDAGLEVRKMTKEDVLAYALTTNPPIQTAGRPLNEVRADLVTFAMNNPIPFFKQNKDTTAAIRMNVADAMMLGIIEYKSERRAFTLTRTEQELFAHVPQEDPQQALVTFLAKPESALHLDEIVKELRWWDEGEPVE